MISYSVYPPDEGIIIANHQETRRSGHLGHALVEYAPGCLLAFYSNCAGSRCEGHSGFGWMEYRRSLDSGESWGDPYVLKYSVDTFLDGLYTISCEKAVVTESGVIVLVLLVNGCNPHWEPFYEPLVIRSFDGGYNWTEPARLSDYRGRVYDMKYRTGDILALHFCNPADVHFTGNAPEHQYRLYASKDGEVWEERSVVPFDTQGRGYGAIEILPNGRLAAYAYNIKDEYNLDLCVSADGGRTWEKRDAIYLDKRIRNPQVSKANGRYFLHGRSGCEEHDMPSDFVLYASEDGIHFDEGNYIRITPERGNGAAGYYSNSIPVGDRLLIQYSLPYDRNRTNVCHTWIEDIR